jgi:hypothetical protein
MRTCSTVDSGTDGGHDLAPRPTRGESQDNPPADLQLVVPGAVVVECEACPVRVPPVVLDCDLALRIGQVEPNSPATDSDSVLLHWARQPSTKQDLGHIHLTIAPAGSNPVEAVGEYRPHHRAAPPALRLEGSEDAEDLAWRHQPSAFGIVDEAREAPWPNDRREIAQCARDGCDGNAVMSRGVTRTPHVGLVDHDVGQPRVLSTRDCDLEDVAAEAGKLPECGGRSERRDCLVTGSEARGKQMLIPALRRTCASIDSAPERHETTRGHQMVKLVTSARFEYLARGDQAELAIPETTDNSHVRKDRIGV